MVRLAADWGLIGLDAIKKSTVLNRMGKDILGPLLFRLEIYNNGSKKSRSIQPFFFACIVVILVAVDEQKSAKIGRRRECLTSNI
jgi:hypothetical protein